MVVSAEGKGLERTRSGDWQEEDRKETTDDVSKAWDDVETAGSRYCGTSSGGDLFTDGAASGIEVA
jgi:hypothetical protein